MSKTVECVAKAIQSAVLLTHDEACDAARAAMNVLHEPTVWQPIATAPDHVQAAATWLGIKLGQSRINIHYGPGVELYALCATGVAGVQADLWTRLPDFPSIKIRSR